MSAKDAIRPIRVTTDSLLRQRIKFHGSANYWEANYNHGGTSGGGSYGELARGKADFLNTFTHRHSIVSVIELGVATAINCHWLSILDMWASTYLRPL